MEMDRDRALRAFAAYVRPYDAHDAKIRLKITHTYRVAALCERIARSLALDGTDVDFAWLCGLLHDIGRFEQLRRYGTFNDAVSIDHALCSVQVLFDEGHIAEFAPALAGDETLYTAIRQHNAYRLPGSLDARTRRFCQILRDADKVDIFRVNTETPLEEIYGVSTGALRESPLTPAVVRAFYEHHAVLRSLKRAPADHVVGHLSLVYELCYPESLRAAAEQGYLWRLAAFESSNHETAAALAAMRGHLRAWVGEALQTASDGV